MISATQSAGCNSSAGNGIPGSFAMPTGVVLTTPSASANAFRKSLPGSPAPHRSVPITRRSRSAARAQSVSTIGSWPTPSVRAAEPRRRLRRRHRTAPPGPRATSARPRRKPSAKPHQSVLWPMLRPSLNTTVLTAPSARASADSSSQQRNDRLLAGIGHVKPVEAHPLAAVTSSGRASGPTPSLSRSISL